MYLKPNYIKAMKEQTYKNRVKKLMKLEDELIKLISESDNEELANKFLEWQKQRNLCNTAYIIFISNLMRTAK